ncbi:caspase family protein [Glycomyces luteolus]|uniref:Caspase family protein n=1 Tax=Glycomyces luteolus TaxID=2670330 RepID=A0A9X3PBQ8_9ACTN|nr:caspase family protein [Glycomyces luteolus]MDA1362463.1 caspase family protein [Glycomyces luteolus]
MPPPGSHAILVGVSEYESSEFLPIPAAFNSLKAMRDMLTDSSLCGWGSDQVTFIPNPQRVDHLAVQIANIAKRTTGALLVYFVGHGTLTDRGDLCLTVTTTQPEYPTYTGLTWEGLSNALLLSPAQVRITILDCCFAGQAIEALVTDDDKGLADLAHIQGGYTLAATAPNRTAHVPVFDQQVTACTSFTGELQELLTAGIQGRPEILTFGDIYSRDGWRRGSPSTRCRRRRSR